MFRSEITVRFNDCDSLGHVNNTVYFTYLEESRTPIFRLFNPSLDINTWNIIVASTRCDFLHEVNYGQTLVIYSWIGKIGTSSFVVEQAIQDKDGNWVARGNATLLHYNFDRKKPIPLSEKMRHVLIEHSKEPNNVPSLRN